MPVAKTFQVSQGDIEIFNRLTRHYLTARMIFELLPVLPNNNIKTFKNLQARLKALYTAGYLNRDYRLSQGKGINEYYYFLTKKSANFFEDLEHLKPGKGILKRLEPGSQEHAFMLSDFMVNLEKDIYNSQDQVKMLGFIRENYFDIRIPGQAQNQKDINYKPDGTIFLQADHKPILLFLEIDLSTEPVLPINPYRSSFRKKLIVYSEFKKYFLQHQLINLFGSFPGFRVLTICRSQQRIGSLIKAAREMGKTEMFWFTHAKQIKNHNTLFDCFWQLPNGKVNSLL